ncbi:MAG: hypothetical protein ACRDPC_12830 [Solirubrobacteraceae bacterium]
MASTEWMRNVRPSKHDSALFACRQAMIEPVFGVPKQTARRPLSNAEDESPAAWNGG